MGNGSPCALADANLALGNINFCFERWKLSGESGPALLGVMEPCPHCIFLVVDVKKF